MDIIVNVITNVILYGKLSLYGCYHVKSTISLRSC